MHRSPLPAFPGAALAFAWALGISAACGSEGPGRPELQACAAAPTRPQGLILAGSGSNLAYARAVAERFAHAHPRGASQVAASIGTRGAVAALIDGAIDVGLASRPLKDDERALGVRAEPWARAPFGAVVSRRSAAPESLDAADLAGLLRGDRTAWADGTPVVVLLRERGDSGQALLRRWSPEVADALDGALEAGRWPVLTTDQDMRDALLSTDGALGFLDVGTVRIEGLPLRFVARTDPKPLSLLLGPHSPPLAKEFVAFATSPAAEAVRRLAGYAAP